MSVSADWMTWDVTEAVQAALDSGASSLSLMVYASNEIPLQKLDAEVRVVILVIIVLFFFFFLLLLLGRRRVQTFLFQHRHSGNDVEDDVEKLERVVARLAPGADERAHFFISRCRSESFIDRFAYPGMKSERNTYSTYTTTRDDHKPKDGFRMTHIGKEMPQFYLTHKPSHTRA